MQRQAGAVHRSPRVSMASSVMHTMRTQSPRKAGADGAGHTSGTDTRAVQGAAGAGKREKNAPNSEPAHKGGQELRRSTKPTPLVGFSKEEQGLRADGGMWPDGQHSRESRAANRRKTQRWATGSKTSASQR